ncbi:CMRF35-like molecule 8 isoform X3 [Arapaima gigas]
MDPLVLYLFLLSFMALPDFLCLGAAGVKTFDWLKAQTGKSVYVPCFYSEEYRENVKYWSKGKKHFTVVRTDSPQRTHRVSIADNPARLVFFVTMRNLQDGDSDTYWCGVERERHSDIFASVKLEVAGVQDVRTESWVSAETGGSVTIPCHYDQKYKHHVKYWCRGYIWSSCSTVVRTDSPQRRGEVSITDHPNRLLFTVTMKNLQEKDSDTYWCVVEIVGGQDVGTFLPLKIMNDSKVQIRNQGVTGPDAFNALQSTLTSTGIRSHTDGGVVPSSTSIEDTPTAAKPLWLALLVILGLLLLLLVAVVMGTAFMLRKQKGAKAKSRETLSSSPHTPTTDHELTYSIILHQKPAAQREINQPSASPEDAVIYSTTV